MATMKQATQKAEPSKAQASASTQGEGITMNQSAVEAGKELAMQQANAPVPFLAAYDGPTGAEGIEDKDVTIPRLKIGQAISDEVKSGAVKEGSLFLNVTGQAVWEPGDDPLPCIVVAVSKEYILWRDRLDNGGGIIARARPEYQADGFKRYKWDNGNQKFENNIGGKMKVAWETKTYTTDSKEPLADEDNLAAWGTEVPGNAESGPAATAHHNYLVLLPTRGNVIAALSMSRTGVKVAKGLNASIRMGASRFSPLPMLKFNLTTFEDASGLKPFMNWAVKPAGKLVDEQGRLNDPKDVTLAENAMHWFKAYAAGGYVVDLSDTKDKTPAGAKAGDAMDDEIPF